MEADSRGTHPELHLGTVTLHQEPPNFIILRGLGGQNRANGLEIFLPHHDQKRVKTPGAWLHTHGLHSPWMLEEATLGFSSPTLSPPLPF